MNETGKAEVRPYRCPGCNAKLSEGGAAALEHMEHCTSLQDMIEVGYMFGKGSDEGGMFGRYPCPRLTMKILATHEAD